MNCPNCHQPIRDGAQFCTNCGARTMHGAQPSGADSLPTIESGRGGATGAGASGSTGAGAAGATEGGRGAGDAGGELQAGRVLDGKYEIVGRLGSGGMGAVYRARRVLIGDEVAVKVLHTKFVGDDTLVERFRREARAAAQLQHANVVTIHDYGEARGAEGFAYIVMELVRGESLRELLRREGRLAPARAVSLMRDVCAGVGAAHRRGIVHRDIKPDNIIVVPPDEDNASERVKVVDFGIAKLRDMASDGTLTEAGVVVGTPFYMAPEQCRGEQLDARADVYSLGALLYEMLAGSPPFTAPSLVGVIVKHMSEPPPPLPADAAAPPALRDAVMRALAKDPDGRQRDASEFSREIQSALGSPPTAAPSQTEAPRAQTSDAAPFTETTRPAPVVPLHAPPPPQPDPRAQTHPQPPQQQTHPHAPQPRVPQTRPQPTHAPQPQPQQTFPPAAAPPRRRSRAPLVLGVLAVLLVGAAVLGLVGYMMLNNRQPANVNVNVRPKPSPASNANNANAAPTPATIVVSEQMLRAEQKVVTGAALAGDDLAGLTAQQLRLLRNAVFARYGRVFQAGELQQYYQTRPWYRPRPDLKDPALTPADRANADLIKAYEETNGAPPRVDTTRVAKEVGDALDAWAESTRERDLNAHSRSYADTLETFYKRSNVPASRVLAERAIAFTRYDTMDVRIENVEIQADPSGRRATATFDKSWEFHSDDKTSNGSVRQQLTFVKQGDRWLITGERDLQVYSSGGEDY